MKTILFALLLGTANQVWSHALLVYPPPRTPSDGIKTGPCGATKTGNPTTLAPGSTITVQWRETIDHPGYYGLSLTTTSNDADLDLPTNVIRANLPDTQGAPLPHNYTATITLPNVTCDNCTLRLIQYMTESTPPSLYYSCADIRLGSGGGGGGPTPVVQKNEQPAQNPQPRMSSCGSMSGGGSNASLQLWWWIAPALVFARRRRNPPPK